MYIDVFIIKVMSSFYIHFGEERKKIAHNSISSINSSFMTVHLVILIYIFYISLCVYIYSLYIIIYISYITTIIYKYESSFSPPF